MHACFEQPLYDRFRRKMHMRMIAFGAILLTAIGCGQNEKIASLEKQNQELKAEADKSHATADYDLQAKCSKDAKASFNENWSREKDTILLDYTNHYNKSMNKCFILIEYHFEVGNRGSWTSDMTLWDVHENAKYGEFSEGNTVYTKPDRTEKTVVTCEIDGKKCNAAEEFNDLVHPYMNN
jgi:hypothetical protein